MMTLRLCGTMTVLGGAIGLVTGLVLGSIYGVMLGVFFMVENLGTLPLGAYQPVIEDLAFWLGTTFVVTGISLIIAVPFGFVMGLLGGLLLGIFTRLVFFPLTNVIEYRHVVRLTSVVYGVTVPLTLAIQLFGTQLPSVFGGVLNRPDILGYMMYPILPALLAGGGALSVGQQIARWYENEMKKEKQNA